MDLTINLVSSICWEIIAKLPLRLNNQTLPVFKLLLDGVYDFSPPFSESRWKIYWRRSPGDYLEITDYFSLCSFVNLAAVPELYLVIGDAEKFYADTEKFLRMLDLMELKRVKELRRSKYDLKSEADVIEEQIEECRTTLNDPVVSTIEYKNDTDVINFALRNMPMGRCYTADICSGYNLIDCVRKAMKGRIINCSPHQDIYFLETHAKNEESNLENLFVSPAGREMLKYKPNTKLKQKINPNLEFLTTIQNPNGQSNLRHESRSNKTSDKNGSVTSSTSCHNMTDVPSTSAITDAEKPANLDLYEEAAAILGLTCSQTDDCRCIECQCHYFDFEEEIDFPTAGNDYGQLLNVDHTSSCSIQ